ncbi:MAG TPA: response regulator transcription factor [Gemmatimonadaceae bacterium]|nr:response regulator transcription factor [Gemmatimonadaceae bacterium]
MRILVVEDDERMGRFVRRLLVEDGYAVDVAATGERGLLDASVNDYDLVLLDLGLPDRSGLAILRALRREGNAVPVVVLSGRRDEPEIVRALDAGADDYLVKPVSGPMLLARVRAGLRRGGATRDETLACGGFVVHRLTRTIWCKGAALDLTPREYALLEHLVLHCGEVVTRSSLRERIWESEADLDSNIIDAAIARLRRRLERSDAAGSIITVRGVGYRLADGVAPRRHARETGPT